MNLLKSRLFLENPGYILAALFSIFLILYAWTSYKAKYLDYQPVVFLENNQQESEQSNISEDEEDWDFDEVWDFSKDDEALFFNGYGNNPNLVEYYDELKQEGYFKGPYPRVQRHIQTDRIFHASYQGGNITIYLKLSGFNGTAFYSSMVEGWYYDEKSDFKKTLKGVVFGDMIYVFNYDINKIEDEDFKSIQNHLEDVGDFNYFADFKGFNERFIITKEEKSWTKNGRTIPLTFKGEDNFRPIFDTEYEIFKTVDYLHLGPGSSFDLRSVGKYTESWYEGDFKLIAHQNNTYLLEFDFLANPLILGQCGAGTNAGILKLEFDKLHRLIDYRIYYHTNCNSGIWLEEKKVRGNKIIYEYTDYGEDLREIIIDLRNMTVTER